MYISRNTRSRWHTKFRFSAF